MINMCLNNFFFKARLVVCCLLLIGVVKAQQPKLILPIGHSDMVYSANFSPDGSRILTSSDIAKLWDAQSGLLLTDLDNGPYQTFIFNQLRVSKERA
jgi:WD40 repeat protein